MPTIHRSIAKLKYEPSVIAGTNRATGSSKANFSTPSQPLVLALLDRNHSSKKFFLAKENEDTLVLCSMDGELRQYSVKNDNRPPIRLIHTEDVFASEIG